MGMLTRGRDEGWQWPVQGPSVASIPLRIKVQAWTEVLKAWHDPGLSNAMATGDKWLLSI